MEDSIELLAAYSFDVKEVQPWHLQLRLEEYPEWHWDWYHTTGTLVSCCDGSFRNIGTYDDAEDVALIIRNRIRG